MDEVVKIPGQTCLSVGRDLAIHLWTQVTDLPEGEISSLVIQALKTIGNGNVTRGEKQKIMELLQREDPENLSTM